MKKNWKSFPSFFDKKKSECESESESALQLVDVNQTFLIIKPLNLGTKQHDHDSHLNESACSCTQPKKYCILPIV